MISRVGRIFLSYTYSDSAYIQPGGCWALPGPEAAGSYLARRLLGPTWPGGCWVLPGPEAAGSYLARRLLGPVNGCMLPELPELSHAGQEPRQWGDGCGSGRGQEKGVQLFRGGEIGPWRERGQGGEQGRRGGQGWDGRKRGWGGRKEGS